MHKKQFKELPLAYKDPNGRVVISNAFRTPPSVSLESRRDVI